MVKKMNIGVNQKKEFFKKYFFMVVASLFYAISIDFFLAPNKIVAGGATGVATMLNVLFNTNIGLMTVVVNIPILILAWKQQGWRFVLDCLITLITLGLITDGIMLIPTVKNLIPITDNVLLASIYAGLTQGIALGFYLKYKVSSGGTETLGRVLQNKIKVISIPTTIAILDAIVVIAGTIVLKNPENMLYVLVIIFISTKVSDIVLMGINKAKLCYIITNYPEEVSEVLMQSLKRGVTMIDGTGMYTSKKHSMLMICVKPSQIQQVKNLLKYIDTHA
ncbi:MAG: YitT family protein, partial [Clostridia bacterium]